MLFPVLLGSIPVLGYALTREYFSSYSYEYLAVSVLETVVLTFVGFEFVNPRKEDILRLALSGLLIFGFPVKLYMIAIMAQGGVSIGELHGPLFAAMVSPRTQLEAHTIGILVLLALWVGAQAAAIVYRSSSGPNRRPKRRALLNESTLWGLLVLGVLVSLVTGITMVVLNIGVMGQGQTRLPFRLGGWCVYTRSVFLVYYFLAIVLECSVAGRGRIAKIAICVLLLHCLSYQLWTGSRGFLVVVIMQIILFGILSGYKLSFSRRQFALLTVLVLGLYPVLTTLRSYRNSLSAGYVESFQAGVEEVRGTDARSGASDVALSLSLRITGAEGLCLAIEYGPLNGSVIELVKYLFFDPDRRFASVFTQEIAGLSNAKNFQLASGLIGEVYLMGGVGLSLIAPLVFAFLGNMIWYAFTRRCGQGHVAVLASQVFVLVMHTFMEGDLPVSVFGGLVVAGSWVVCKYIIASPRIGERAPGIRGLKANGIATIQ